MSAVLERARDGHGLSEAQATALLVERDPVAVEQIRNAADELRRELAGDTVGFVVDRAIEISGPDDDRCGVCRPSAPSPTHTIGEVELEQRVKDAVAGGATALRLETGSAPRWTLDDYEGWLRLAKLFAREYGRDLDLQAYGPHEIAMITGDSGLPLDRLLGRLRDAGLGSMTVHSPWPAVANGRPQAPAVTDDLPSWAAVVGACRRTGITVTADAGPTRLGDPCGYARFLAAVGRVQWGCGGIVSFADRRWSIPRRAWHAADGPAPSTDGELRRIAVARLALGRSVVHVQASGSIADAIEGLRWGANDLGGTVTDARATARALRPDELIAAAHAAGRPAAERTAGYTVTRRFPVGGGACDERSITSG